MPKTFLCGRYSRTWARKSSRRSAHSTIRNARPRSCHDFFAEVLPDYDRDRVHDSDIKKLIQWYNILVKNGYTDFEATLSPTVGDNVDDRKEADATEA